MIKALLFDLDGTLFDSSEANVRAYTLAFKKAGVPFNVSEYRKLFGLRFKEMLAKIAPGTPPTKGDEIRRLKAEFYKKNLSLVKQNTALLELQKSSKGKFLTALVTTASKQNVTNLLEHFQIPWEAFDTVIVGEDVTNSKPDPECYLKALKALGVKPAEACVFEDSSVGIAAAKAAGTEVVRVKL